MHSLGKWEELADALRDEVAEYGGLLALLDEQRDAIMSQNVDVLMEANERVQEQAAYAEHFKDVREEVSSRLSQAVGCPVGATVKELVGYLPVEARALFEALLGESRGVATSVKKKVDRNTHLLTHAEDLNSKLLLAMRPSSTSRTYTKRGGFRLKTDPSVGGLDVSA